MHHFHLRFNFETSAYTLLTQWSSFKIHVEITGHACYASVYRHWFLCCPWGLTLSGVSVKEDSTTSPGNDKSQKRQISSSINCKQWPENKNSVRRITRLKKQHSKGRKKTSLELRKPKFKRFQL